MQINAAVCALIPPLEKFPVRLVGETEVEREGKVYRMIRLLGNQTSGKRRQSTTVGGDQVIVEYKNGGAWKEIVSIVGRRKV